MSRQFKYFMFIIFLFSSLVIFSHQVLVAQETVKIINQSLSEGITFELDTDPLTPSANFLVISDTSHQMLVLSSLILNDQNIWLKKSSEVAVDVENAVHWNYDVDSQLLFINLTSIKQTFSSETILQITVLPIKTFQSNFFLSIFESSTNSGNLPENLQKISDLNVDIK